METPRVKVPDDGAIVKLEKATLNVEEVVLIPASCVTALYEIWLLVQPGME